MIKWHREVLAQAFEASIEALEDEIKDANKTLHGATLSRQDTDFIEQLYIATSNAIAQCRRNITDCDDSGERK